VYQSRNNRTTFLALGQSRYLLSNQCVNLQCISGTDTTSSLCEWIMAYLLHNPAWQARIHKELSDITGNNSRRVYLSDKENAHITNAFIEEVRKR